MTKAQIKVGLGLAVAAGGVQIAAWTLAPEVLSYLYFTFSGFCAGLSVAFWWRD